MEFKDVLNRRYSCRAFVAQAVEKEKLDRILEAGRMAPTVANRLYQELGFVKYETNCYKMNCEK